MKNKVILAFACAAITLFSGCSSGSTSDRDTISRLESELAELEAETNETENSLTSGPDTETMSPDDTSAGTFVVDPIIDSGVTDLYTDVFLPLFDGMSVMTFDIGREIVKPASVNGYTVDIIEPTEEDFGEITITANDGDSVYAIFIYDFHREDEKDTLSLLKYSHGEYEFTASDSAHIAEVSYEIIDDDHDPRNYKVDSLSECEQFMFGSGIAQEQSNEITLLYGKLLDKKAVGTSLTIKAKIEPSYSNKATIDQNYYNIEDIIKNQGGTQFTYIDYWAVADMTDGSESKVISFTVSDDVIKKIADSQITANTLGDYVDDLYILPSLQN